MQDMTYIERVAFCRGKVAVESSPSSMEQRDSSPRRRLFMKRIPRVVRTLISRFWKRKASRTADRSSAIAKYKVKEKKNGDYILDQTKRNRDNDDNDDVCYRQDLAQITPDEKPKAESNVGRDGFGSGNSCFLEKAILQYNDSTSFHNSVAVPRRRLDFETLANVLSPIFSDAN